VDLDKEQQAVVNSDESLMVVAGPGSGKTRVLTEKARKLFSLGENLLCLTFTRSAAREMQSRIPGVPASTIHSFCCGLVGWKESWGYPGLLWRAIMDKERPRFSWILLDEVQDLNPEELDVALSLVGGKIFAVGDPYQSIYGFQGALGPRVMDILKKFRCRRVDLHNNYRSCPEVVSKLEKIFKRGLVSREVKENGLTAILCRTNDDVFLVSGYLKKEGKPHTLRLSVEYLDSKEKVILGENNLRLSTIHQSKGLEFDRVILYNWFPNIEQDEEIRTYYVAAARASKEFKEVFSLEELVTFI
jgi:superfamily I DNA/RNA helicase